jgi:hypothetical protein
LLTPFTVLPDPSPPYLPLDIDDIRQVIDDKNLLLIPTPSSSETSLNSIKTDEAMAAQAQVALREQKYKVKALLEAVRHHLFPEKLANQVEDSKSGKRL